MQLSSASVSRAQHEQDVDEYSGWFGGGAFASKSQQVPPTSWRVSARSISARLSRPSGDLPIRLKSRRRTASLFESRSTNCGTLPGRFVSAITVYSTKFARRDSSYSAGYHQVGDYGGEPMSRVTRREAKTLRERSSEMDREGGGLPLEEIERRMRVGMVQDLHRMARTYDGTPRKAKALLEAILTAEEEGLSAEVFAKVRREASEALRRRAA
jgi:hypothetical protein